MADDEKDSPTRDKGSESTKTGDSKVKKEGDEVKNEPVDESSSGSGSTALSDILAASQMTAQMSALTAQASQLAMATQLLNLPGYSQAYLAAAAGKPLANMLSMALQQQQQVGHVLGPVIHVPTVSVPQQLAAAVAVSAASQVTPPKRGRGSRGGALSRSRAGMSAINKLKRLDS